MPGRFRLSRRARRSRSPSSISEIIQEASTGCWGSSSWRLQQRSIHPSTWKGNSANFSLTAFSEVAPDILNLHNWPRSSTQGGADQPALYVKEVRQSDVSCSAALRGRERLPKGGATG